MGIDLSVGRPDNGAAVDPMVTLDGIAILIVEDDDDARELMQAVLEQRGARVWAASSVSQAFELLESIQPNVIVSDIAMPDEDGFSLARRIRQRPADTGPMPIVAVSAYAAASDRVRALAAGFDCYLHKPVDFDELSLAINGLVEQSDDQRTA